MSQRGPTTLAVVTNRARASVRPSKSRIVGDTVLSAIGSNVVYVGAHERGVNETVTVRSHQRRTASFEGQPISLADAKKIRGKLKKNLKRAIATVRTHQRKMNLPARAPIRRGIEERLPQYQQAVDSAIEHALTKD